MLVYLMRHGIAFPRLDPDCPPDEERPLTEKGRVRTEAAARGLRTLGVEPTLVLTSGLARAVETAQIAAEVLDVDRSLEVTDCLEPGASPDELLATLKSLEEPRVLCAGHSPNLDRVIAAATGAPFGAVFLKKCATACLEFPWGVPEPQQGVPSAAVAELLWLIPPRTLRLLGRIEG